MPLAGKIIYVSPENIIYCKADGNYTEIFLKEGKKEMVSKKLKTIEELFNNNMFFRVHNSFLVNIHYIKEFIKGEGQYLVLENQMKIPVSRSKRSTLIDLLNN